MKVMQVMHKGQITLIENRQFLVKNAILVIQGLRTNQNKHFELSHDEIAL